MEVSEKRLGVGSQIITWMINDQVMCLQSKLRGPRHL